MATRDPPPTRPFDAAATIPALEVRGLQAEKQAVEVHRQMHSGGRRRRATVVSRTVSHAALRLAEGLGCGDHAMAYQQAQWVACRNPCPYLREPSSL